MAEWWYHVLHKCKGCGRTWDEYDPSGGGCDSGLSSCLVVVEECDECFLERQAEEICQEQALQSLEERLEDAVVCKGCGEVTNNADDYCGGNVCLRQEWEQEVDEIYAAEELERAQMLEDERRNDS